MESASSQKLSNLQGKNSRLAAELKVNEKVVAELEQKIESLNRQQENYTDTLTCVDRYACTLCVASEVLAKFPLLSLAAD